MLGGRHFAQWGRKSRAGCRGSRCVGVVHKNRNEVAWTQTTKNMVEKERLPASQMDSFSISIIQEHGTQQRGRGGALFKERKQEQFEDLAMNGGRR